MTEFEYLAVFVSIIFDLFLVIILWSVAHYVAAMDLPAVRVTLHRRQPVRAGVEQAWLLSLDGLVPVAVHDNLGIRGATFPGLIRYAGNETKL